MKIKVINNIITSTERFFKKCYNRILELFGIAPSQLYNTTVIFVDKTLVNTESKLEELQSIIKKKTMQDCMYDLSEYKYIHSLNMKRNSYINNSLFPHNLYQDVSKNKHKYAVCIFDTAWIGEEQFDDMICDLDPSDNNVFISENNKKIDAKSFIYLDSISGLLDTKIVTYEKFFNELDRIMY